MTASFSDDAGVAAAAALRELAAAQRAGELAATATSDDGLVTARVDGGRLQSLELDPKIMRKSADDVARLVLAAAASAREEHLAKRARRTEELGAQRPDRDEVMARLDQLQRAVRDAEGDMRTVADRMHTESLRRDDAR